MISRYEHNISFAGWIAISMYKELSFRLNLQLLNFMQFWMAIYCPFSFKLFCKIIPIVLEHASSPKYSPDMRSLII